MEQFLRTYYTNLNPNATEEEILAFLQSQGFGNTTTTEGITAINPMPIQTGGDGGEGITGIDLPVGAKPPGPIVRTLATIFAPPVGIAMNLQALADQGKLPFGLNQKLGSRASGNVEVDLPTSDDPGTVGGSSFDAETGGTFGTSTNDASTFSDYS
tara:strand:+ start:144 stop:611 length:468 start_codon:yes stop_codon:yes gene_type:complete